MSRIIPIHPLFSDPDNEGCLSFEEIQLYLNNEFNSNDLRKIESHLSHCELCSDAVEGFQSSTKPFSEHQLRLNKLQNTISPPKPIPFLGIKNSAWAAVILLMIVSLFSLFYIQLQLESENKEMAMEATGALATSETTVDQTIAISDDNALKTEVTSSALDKEQNVQRSELKKRSISKDEAVSLSENQAFLNTSDESAPFDTNNQSITIVEESEASATKKNTVSNAEVETKAKEDLTEKEYAQSSANYRRNDLNEQSELKTARMLIEDQKPEKALKIYDSVDRTSLNEQDAFYYGKANFLSKKYSDALETLEDVIAIKGVYKEEAMYLAGLSAKQLNKTDLAILYLNSVCESKGKFSSKACEERKKIKK